MRIPVRHQVSIWLVIGLLVAPTTVSNAQQRYALLVGVGQYPFLDKSLQLEGPPNDVRLVREYLLHTERFDADSIVWLTDDGPAAPSRNNILDALADLEQRVSDGDFVLLYFSGHGSRQPAKADASEEYDGFDEIFLPADARGWNDYIGSVENAITDNELGALIGSYRNKGADVWLIADSCHSGTMTRGAGDDSVRTRLARGSALGIPESQSGSAASAANEVPLISSSHSLIDESATAEPGMLIAFSGAHTSQEAPEMLLPRRHEQAEPRGLLTHAAFTALSRFPGVSYRQLAQLISDQYASIPWSRSTPQFYGSHMDRVVFNGSSERASLFRAELDDDRSTLTMEAGTLRGFDVAAIVAIHTDAQDVDESLVGTGTVAKATITDSVVAAIEWEEHDEDADADGCQGRRCVPAGYRKQVYVRLVAPAYSRNVVITALETARNEDNQRLTEILAALEPQVEFVEFADDNSDADYFVAFFENRFWLLRLGQSLPCSVRRIAEDQRHQCEETRQPEQHLWSPPEDAPMLLSKAAKVAQLNRLQGMVSSPDTLSIDVQVQRSAHEALVSLAQSPEPLNPGATIYYSIHPDSDISWDVFLFYVDSQLGITALLNPGHSVRVSPGEKIAKKLGTINDETLGVESLVIIAEPAEEHYGIESDYYFLTQDSHDLVLTKGKSSSSPLASLLGEIWAESDELSTKGLRRDELTPQIRVFTWTVERTTD